MTPAPAEPREYDVDQHRAAWSWAAYYGYIGPWYSQLQWERGAYVIDPSLLEASEGAWSAEMLVRNDSLRTFAGLGVTATLLGQSGEVLDKVSGTSPVLGIRAGEPAPVKLSSDVDASRVAEVAYEATAQPSPPSTRQFEASLIRSFPPGKREPIQLQGLQEPRGLDSYPYTLLYQVKNESGEDASDFHLVIAWMDDEDRIVFISDGARPVDYGQTAEQRQFLQDLVVRVPPGPLAERLSGLRQLVWVYGL
jgi:hypothetical protein